MGNTHVQKDITSANLIASQFVVLSILDDDGGDPREIGLVLGISIGDNRPVQVQGEIGSGYLLTLINEGQQQMSFQRIVPLESGSSSRYQSALGVLYDTLGAGYLAYDLDELPKYKKPIQIGLEFLDNGTPIAKMWLKNAAVSSVSLTIAAGANYTAEPITIAWEDTIYQDLGTTDITDQEENVPDLG